MSFGITIYLQVGLEDRWSSYLVLDKGYVVCDVYIILTTRDMNVQVLTNDTI